MAKKRPEWKTDPNSFFHPNTHTAFLIVCPIVMAIAAGIFALCLSFTYDFLTAPYHIEVEATLEDITEGETEKWEYIQSKEEQPNPNLRETRTYTEYYTVYHWKYYVDGEPHTYTSTTDGGTVGSTKSMTFWSRDGKEYFRHYSSGLNYVFMALAAAVFLAALYIIVRIIIIKIIMAKEKKQKEERKLMQPPQPINLGNYDGKRVRITDSSGDIFEGIATYCNKDYCEHEYGKVEPALQIANFIFFRSNVEKVESLKNKPYSAPFGTIEEMNYQDGISSIEDELFCEEDESIYRMLLCLEEHVIRRGEACEGLSHVLQDLLKMDLSDRSRKKAEELIAAQNYPTKE